MKKTIGFLFTASIVLAMVFTLGYAEDRLADESADPLCKEENKKKYVSSYGRGESTVNEQMALEMAIKEAKTYLVEIIGSITSEAISIADKSVLCKTMTFSIDENFAANVHIRLDRAYLTTGGKK
jgi:hypothetical protein